MAHGLSDLDARVAVITGGAAGIGLAMAHCFASEGMKIVIADIDAGALEIATAELEVAGAEVLAVETDVTSLEQVQALAEQTLERFGAVHILCNNAGILVFGSHTELDIADWRLAMEVDFFSVVNGHQVFLPIMLAQDEPSHIINTASVAGLMTTGILGPYHAAKHAVVAISESLHKELEGLPECKVGVSVLCPSFVNTRIADSQRYRPNRKQGQVEAEVQEAVSEMAASGIDASEVATKVLVGVREGAFWVLTHDATEEMIDERFEGIKRAIPGEGA